VAVLVDLFVVVQVIPVGEVVDEYNYNTEKKRVLNQV
jgi:hypothetical protein